MCTYSMAIQQIYTYVFNWIIKINDNEPKVGHLGKTMCLFLVSLQNAFTIKVQKVKLRDSGLRYKHLHLHLIKQRLLTLFFSGL